MKGYQSMFTKQQYEIMAELLGRTVKDVIKQPHAGFDALVNLVNDLTDVFEADNPRFDTERFLKAVDKYAQETVFVTEDQED